MRIKGGRIRFRKKGGFRIKERSDDEHDNEVIAIFTIVTMIKSSILS